LRRIHIPCSYRNAALLGRRRLNKSNLCCTWMRRLIGGLHGRQPSLANLGLDNDGSRRCWFWNMAPPSRLHYSRLCLDRCISLAWTAIRGLVPRSGQGSVRCHAALNFSMAAPPAVNRMPPRCHSLRSRNLSMALMARAVASRSCFCSLRLTRIGSNNDQGNSIPPKVAGAILNS
jgi:hypothetical protein